MLQHESSARYKFTRQVKGKFQARVWDGRLRLHVNLGLYDHERAAWDASKRFFLRGEWPSHVLPPFVRELSSGGYVATVALGGPECRLIRRIEAKPTPCEAHVAMLVDLMRVSGNHDPRRLFSVHNPAIAAYCVLRNPWAWRWPNELIEELTVEMVDECRQRIDRGGGYAEAAQRWASAENGVSVRRETCGVVRRPQYVIGR